MCKSGENMKKGLKISLIVLGVLVGIIAIDTLQAKIFDNSPLLKIRDNLNGIGYIDKGILVNHYYCNNNEKVTTWKGIKFACSEIEQNKEETKFSKVVQNLFIEFDVPNDWHYEELENEENVFELKIYKDSLERYALLKVSDNPLGVCGTGLTEGALLLNSGRYADMGSYDDALWSYISFSFADYAFILNNSLNEVEASEMLEFIKTIRIFEDKGIDFYIKKPEYQNDIKFNLYSSNSEQKIYLAGNIENVYVTSNNLLTLKDYMEQETPSSFESLSNITNQLTVYKALNDGGTMIYKEKDKDMTIITCNKLNGNKNIYIGDYLLEYTNDLCE